MIAEDGSLSPRLGLALLMRAVIHLAKGQSAAYLVPSLRTVLRALEAEEQNRSVSKRGAKVPMGMG
jgi:hypothetical protein